MAGSNAALAIEPTAPVRTYGGPVFAFVLDAETRSRIEDELTAPTAGSLSIVEGDIERALGLQEWPADIAGVVVDVGESASPETDVAALVSILPRTCVVVAVGALNDVMLYRDVVGAGAADYVVRGPREGALLQAFDRAFSLREREARMLAAAQAAHQQNVVPHPSAADLPGSRLVAIMGSRGGVGATSLAIATTWLLAERSQGDALIIDLDLHYGSLMLALDLEPTDALREALLAPERVDNFFIDQAVQRKGSMLRVLGSEEPPTSAHHFPPENVGELVDRLRGRFPWIVVDVPRADPAIQRAVVEAATDVMLVCDPTLPGVRDAMRLNQMVQEANPEARVHVVVGGASDPRKAPIKHADIERSLKQKVALVVPHDDKQTVVAVNAGKPLPEVAPNSPVVKALRTFVTSTLALETGKAAGKEKPAKKSGFFFFKRKQA